MAWTEGLGSRLLGRRRRQEVQSASSFVHRAPAPDVQEHMETVPSILVDVLGVDLPWESMRILEIGCGPGLTALGLARKVRPRLLAAIDCSSQMSQTLRDGEGGGICETWPSCLKYAVCDASHLPFREEQFDLIFSWSVFEHLADPAGVLREAGRTLTMDGILYIQISPLYYSGFGHHLWEYVTDPFAHLILNEQELKERFFGGQGDMERKQAVWATFSGLNRITVSQLQRLLHDAGFTLVQAILQNDDLRGVHFDSGLFNHPLQDLATVQVNLVARKSSEA